MLDMWVDNEPCRKVLLGGTKLGGRLFTGVFGGSWVGGEVASHTSYDTRVGVVNGRGSVKPHSDSLSLTTVCLSGPIHDP